MGADAQGTRQAHVRGAWATFVETALPECELLVVLSGDGSTLAADLVMLDSRRKIKGLAFVESTFQVLSWP